MHSIKNIKNSTKYVIVTGGVLSGLGKGVVSASIAKILSTGNKIVTIKCDGYLNVDPGTMNPIEHGEVFVLDDGGEVDLDFGHYERFLGIDCRFDWNLTSGKIFKFVIDKERKGDYLGKTVQMIPHVTNEIKKKFHDIARKEKADIVMIEMGGTVGDIEMMLFNEAARQMRLDVGRNNMCFVHVTYVPEPSSVGEQKTKPTQQSVETLRRAGINPEIIIGRSPRPLGKRTKQKIALFANLLPEEVISDPDFEQVYELPIIFEKEGLPELLKQKLSIGKTNDLKNWKNIVNNIKNPKQNINIAICGKYTELHDSYISIMEALKHCCGHSKIKTTLKWIETTEIEEGKLTVEDSMKDIDGVIIPGGFGSRGTEGKISVMRYVRENKVPFLGICLGMQIAVIEFARNVCGLKGANSTEFDENCMHPVIDMLPEQKSITDKGGTMRLGGHDVRIKEATKAYAMFKSDKIRRRFRHRYEVNPDYVGQLIEKGLVFSGYTPDKKIMQITELSDHPYFIAGQFHPELTSRVEHPDEMFLGLVKAAAKRKR